MDADVIEARLEGLIVLTPFDLDLLWALDRKPQSPEEISKRLESKYSTIYLLTSVNFGLDRIYGFGQTTFPRDSFYNWPFLDNYYPWREAWGYSYSVWYRVPTLNRPLRSNEEWRKDEYIGR